MCNKYWNLEQWITRVENWCKKVFFFPSTPFEWSRSNRRTDHTRGKSPIEAPLRVAHFQTLLLPALPTSIRGYRKWWRGRNCFPMEIPSQEGKKEYGLSGINKHISSSRFLSPVSGFFRGEEEGEKVVNCVANRTEEKKEEMKFLFSRRVSDWMSE